MTPLNENCQAYGSFNNSFDMKHTDAFLRTSNMGGVLTYLKLIFFGIPGSLSHKKKHYQVFDAERNCIDPEMADFYHSVYGNIDMSTHINDRHNMSRDVYMLRADLRAAIKKYKEEKLVHGEAEQAH